MKVTEFWHSGRRPQRPQNIKKLQIGTSRNSFKIFFEIFNFEVKFLKKV